MDYFSPTEAQDWKPGYTAEFAKAARAKNKRLDDERKRVAAREHESKQKQAKAAAIKEREKERAKKALQRRLAEETETRIRKRMEKAADVALAEYKESLKFSIAKEMGPLPVRRLAKDIISEFCDKNEISVNEILGRSRMRSLVKLRQAAMAAVYVERPDLSAVQIGKIFNRDHTTVLYSLGQTGVYKFEKKRTKGA